MRVLQIADALGSPGGISVYTVMLEHTLKTLGHLTLTAATKREDLGPLPQDSVHVPTLFGFAKEEDQSLNLSDFAKSLPWKPDLIISHQPPFPEVTRQLTQLAPVIIFQHSYLCHPGHLFRDRDEVCQRSVAGGCLPRWYGRRCGSTKDPRVAIEMIKQAKRDRASLNLATKVVANSNYLAEQLTREGISANRIRVIFPGCSTLIFASAEWQPRSATPLVSFAGRVVYGKGVGVLAEATAALDVRTQVAGVGWYLDRLGRSKSSNLELLGHQDQNQIRGLHQRAWVSALPSLWPEPFGMSGIEALAAGTPVVAFRVGGIPEWLSEDVGEVISPNSDGRTERLLAAISKFVAAPPSDEIAEACKERAESLCGPQIFGEQVQNLLSDR